jgi:hypothetical protein
MKHLTILASVFFVNVMATAKVPTWIKSETTLVHEAALVVADKNCAAKTNVLGQTYVLSRILKSLTVEEVGGSEIYALATLLESYSTNARFNDPCEKTDGKSFGEMISVLGDLESKLK